MITLTTNNPDLSWIIYKNPQTQLSTIEPFDNTLRKGKIYGWYTEPQTATQFKMIFVDHPLESSFNTQEREYLDTTKYASPLIPVGAIDELLKSAATKRQEKDVEGFEHSIQFVCKAPSLTKAKRLAQHMNLEVDLNELAPKLLSVTIKSKNSIYELLNATRLWCIFQAAQCKEVWLDMTESMALKYVKTLNALNAPYFPRYMFLQSLIRSPKVFQAIKPELEQGAFSLHYGDTQQHRFLAVSKALEQNRAKVLVDIGCGEGYYERKLASQYDSVLAYEADLELGAKTARKLEENGTGNVEVLGAADKESLIDLQGADVLVTEVFEHMPKDTAAELLAQILDSSFNKLVITLPNSEFNQFYAIPEGETRHWDHHWEPTLKEAVNFVTKQVASSSKKGRQIEVTQIGDAVLEEDSKISATTMIVVK